MATAATRQQIVRQAHAIASQLRQLETDLRQDHQLLLANEIAVGSKIFRKFIASGLPRVPNDWKAVDPRAAYQLQQANRLVLKRIAERGKSRDPKKSVMAILKDIHRIAATPLRKAERSSRATMDRHPIQWCAVHKHYYSGDRCPLG